MNSRGQDTTETPRDPRNLTFSQASGYEEIPGPLRLGELPKEARTKIWNVFYENLDQSVDRDLMGYPYLISPWRDIMSALQSDYFGLPLDKWDTHLHQTASRFRQVRFTDTPKGGEGQFVGQIASELKHYIDNTREFNKVFDLIYFVMRHPDCPFEFVDAMKEAFEFARLAYVIDKSPPPTIFPAATQEEGEAILESLQALRKAGLTGGTEHLRNASESINDGDWAESIKESIHAFESVARTLAPKAKRLEQVLKSIEKDGALHRALKDAFVKLYGFASDEPGIRHALLNGDGTDVGMDEAVFMLGACASFSSYLWRKHLANMDT
ncbi:MAG: hypothetical protein F4059_00470 [Gemmatimonadetes bacterium]|nr:hypothetical protein [Gemmatimonadota bacterium]